jgi:hypothetical protein
MKYLYVILNLKLNRRAVFANTTIKAVDPNLSLAMVAMYWSLGSQATPFTQPLCSARILTFLSLLVSKTIAVLSVEQEIKNVEHGDLA